MASLAELRAAASGPVPRPKATATVTLVEGQHLLDAFARLHQRMIDVLANAEQSEEAEESKARSRKWVDDAPDSEVEAIKAEQKAILPRLAEFQAEVELVGFEGGEWWRFCEANPPRKDSDIDQRLTGGRCNADAVFQALGRFVATWNGDELQPGDWDSWLAERICVSDRRDMVAEVVDMHEVTVNRVPFSSSVSSGTPTSETD